MSTHDARGRNAILPLPRIVNGHKTLQLSHRHLVRRVHIRRTTQSENSLPSSVSYSTGNMRKSCPLTVVTASPVGLYGAH